MCDPFAIESLSTQSKSNFSWYALILGLSLMYALHRVKLIESDRVSVKKTFVIFQNVTSTALQRICKSIIYFQNFKVFFKPIKNKCCAFLFCTGL